MTDRLPTPDNFIRLADVENGHVADPRHAAMLTAVVNSMHIVGEGIANQGFGSNAAIETKSDNTFVTRYDRVSEAVAAEIYRQAGIGVRGEEGTRIDIGDTIAGIDPLDGTRNYAIGAGDATVLNALYDHEGNVLGAAIGHAATGRIISSFGNGPVELRRIGVDKDNIGHTLRINPDVRTHTNDLTAGSQVMIDNNLPFERTRENGEKIKIFSARQLQTLHSIINEAGLGSIELGSNGAHQFSLLTTEKAAVSITTARGVWEDTVPGVHLAERAGGAAQAFVKSHNGMFVPVDHKTEPDYDVAFIANTPKNLDTITNDLVSSLNAVR